MELHLKHGLVVLVAASLLHRKPKLPNLSDWRASVRLAPLVLLTMLSLVVAYGYDAYEKLFDILLVGLSAADYPQDFDFSLC